MPDNMGEAMAGLRGSDILPEVAIFSALRSRGNVGMES